MRDRSLRNFTEVAEELGTTALAISALVKAKSIETKSMGLPGRARGLDDNDIAILREALRPAPKSPARKSTSRKSSATAAL